MEGSFTINSLQRYLVWYYLQPLFKNIRVAEFPKSGGTWLCQMLADVFELEFPRNRMMPLKKCIQQSHYAAAARYKTILLVRDGRDVYTSAYFHFLYHAKGKPDDLANQWRALIGDFDFENVNEVMPKFIEIFYRNYKAAGQHVNWSSHAKNYLDMGEKVLVVKYEDLLKDAGAELKKIIKWFEFDYSGNIHSIVDKYSFSKRADRKEGVEDRKSFLRKGISGDWKNYFSDEAQSIFNEYHGEMLKTLGYD